MEAMIRSILGGAVAEMAGAARRSAIAALLVMVAAVLAGASIGCALAALWIFAAPQIGPSGGALLVAGVLLVLCLAALGLAAIASRRAKTPRRPAPQTAPLEQAALLFSDNKWAALLAALIAGLVVASDRNKH
jgi:hypothetical protein